MKWWRKWRGGYWVYWHFIGWQKVTQTYYLRVKKERLGQPEWSLECYEDD